jgi:hypothetical protein
LRSTVTNLLALCTTQVQGSNRDGEDNNERPSPTPPVNGNGNCDRASYPDPDVCIPTYLPGLNCGDVPYKNFKVTGRDPHGFDRDNDGIGCDSATGAEDASSATPSPTTPQLNPPLTLTPTPTPTDYCYLPGIGDWWDNPDCKGYLEDKYKNKNQSEPIICTMEISYGQGPCDELYIPPGEDGQCPEGHRSIDERTGCVPENEFGPPPSPSLSPPTPPCDENTPPGELVEMKMICLHVQKRDLINVPQKRNHQVQTGIRRVMVMVMAICD